jgi:micrococcal nuclease
VKVYSVLDGDTFRFRKEDGTLQSVRLLGVDAPESSLTRYRTIECFGKEAKTYLTDLLKNKYVRLEYDPTQQQVDVYGRLIAYVYL